MENPRIFYSDKYSDHAVRSVKCNRITTSAIKICPNCQCLSKNQSFLMTLWRSALGHNQLKTNDRYASRPILLRRLQSARNINFRLRLSNHSLAKKALSLTIYKTTIAEVMAEATKRADQKSIVYNLKVAHRRGLLASKPQVLSFITDISANLKRSTTGKRYSQAMKDLFSWIQIKGGPRMVKFLEDNLDGPCKLGLAVVDMG